LAPLSTPPTGAAEWCGGGGGGPASLCSSDVTDGVDATPGRPDAAPVALS